MNMKEQIHTLSEEMIANLGRLVAIDGVIANNRWVDKTTNNERENFYIRANTIKLLGSKKDAEEAVL